MLSVGHTSPEALYNLAILLEPTSTLGIDTESDLYRILHEITHDVWAQLPQTLLIDFRDPGTIPEDHPPVSFIWDEETQRYF